MPVSEKHTALVLEVVETTLECVAESAEIANEFMREASYVERMFMAFNPEYKESELGQRLARILAKAHALKTVLRDRDESTDFIYAIGQGRGISTQGE